MELQFINEVAETPANTPHPEDSIFNGSAAATRAMTALEYVIAHPDIITIKWDGMPALIFGRNHEGRLVIADKHMFNKPNGRVTSPEGWVEYDNARGSNRADLYQKISNIWAGVDKAVGNSTGFFWGDLLFAHQLEPVGGAFTFRPNVVTYTVPVNSKIGRMINGKVGGIAVHKYLPTESSPPTPWNGQGLGDSSVAMIPPNADIKFKLNDPVQLHEAATNAIAKYGMLADDFLGGLDGVAKNALKKYFNHKITGQTALPLNEWLSSNVSGRQYKKLVGEGDGYLEEKHTGLEALTTIWGVIYEFKANLAQQLESQIQGLGQSVNGHASGEGFVFPTTGGDVKLVQRTIFSRANFAK